MMHVVLCLRNLKDNPDNDFEVSKANILTYTSVIQVPMRDSNDKVMKDIDNNVIPQEVSIITNVSKNDVTMEKWRVNYKLKEEEQ